jgi:uncharacterized membrane protein
MAESLHSSFKKKFLAGLIVTIPAAITIFVLVGLFKFIDGILGPIFDFFLGSHISGLGFITAIIIIFFLGLISTNVFGKRILGFIDKIFLRIPVFKSIYNAVKQLVDAFSPENKSSFKKFVIVEYPKTGAYAFGFLTKECFIESAENEQKLYSVYVPTNNLYLGDIVLVGEKGLIYTDIPIEDGIKIILSGGIAAPEKIIGLKKEIV